MKCILAGKVKLNANGTICEQIKWIQNAWGNFIIISFQIKTKYRFSSFLSAIPFIHILPYLQQYVLV